jgi:hypothetical protein
MAIVYAIIAAMPPAVPVGPPLFHELKPLLLLVNIVPFDENAP